MRRPKADFVLSKPQRREVLELIQTLMFPDGYAANLRRGVNLSTMRVLGMKSHDYHIWIERLLPAMVRGYVPEHVWLVLAELRLCHLKGWDIVHRVSPHGKVPVPNDEDYNLDPNIYDGEFFQEEGLEGRFEIELTEAIGMEVDNETVIEEDTGDEVQNVKDLQMLGRLHLDNDNGNIAHSDSVDYFDMIDNDDETYDPANPDHEDYF